MAVSIDLELKNIFKRRPSASSDEVYELLKFCNFLRRGEEMPFLAFGSERKAESEQDNDADDEDPNRKTETPGVTRVLLDTCEAQHEIDLNVCRRLRNKFCYGQANDRYSACITGKPLPPFPYR